MQNPIIEFIEELEKSDCLEMDSIIEDLLLLKAQEQKDERYFKALFDSILFEQPILHA